ncbi:MAG: cytochrome C biogenesis protein [Candidatus Saganbacteria bacterium]|nr:cytochrome C biogenesis protein [Candidatus Saganbacteria bacterium]
MLLGLFEWLTVTVSSSSGLAILAALIWGILSILLSPCHLASIPLIVGFVNGQGKISTRQAFMISLFFSSGILVSIMAIGLITGLMGRILGDIGAWSSYFVAVVFIFVGLTLLDVIPFPSFGLGNQPVYQKKGILAAFILGLIFGLALGPCTFAYMAPILAIVFNLSSANLIFGLVLIMAYAIGHCSVIVLAGTSTEVVQHYLNWNERSRGTIIVKRICGALVILGGLYLILGG